MVVGAAVVRTAEPEVVGADEELFWKRLRQTALCVARRNSSSSLCCCRSWISCWSPDFLPSSSSVSSWSMFVWSRRRFRHRAAASLFLSRRRLRFSSSSMLSFSSLTGLLPPILLLGSCCCCCCWWWWICEGMARAEAVVEVKVVVGG